ncbi:MAG: ATP-binding protein [Anaerolineae bacterium]|nr:ATP-binding protein [Anaerolineae bacterium]
MTRISLDLLNLFVEPPGDFLYFLVVIAISQVSLFMAVGQRLRQPQDQAATRYTLAMFGLTAAWIMMLAGALYVLLTGQDARLILPPLERAVATVSVLLPGWAFLTVDAPRRARAAGLLLLVLLLVTAIGYMLTGVAWATRFTTLDFNLSQFGLAWTIAPAVLAALGFVLTLIFIREVVDAPLKMVFFLLLLAGHGVMLVLTLRGQVIGDYAGAVRLAYVVALATVPMVIYRMVMAGWQGQLEQVRALAAKTPSPAAARPPIPEKTSTAEVAALRIAETRSTQLLKFLGMTLEAASSASIPEKIMLASMEALRADIGALLRIQDANYADVSLAYDRVRDRNLPAIALNLDNQPTLANALERQDQRVLYPDRDPDEVQDLYTRLDVEQVGAVYFQPLVRQREIVAVLMIGMPYTARELSPVERELLKNIATISSNLLAISYDAQEASTLAEERAIQAMVEGIPTPVMDDADAYSARHELQTSLQFARDQITQLSRQVLELKLKLDDERSRLAGLLGDSQQNMTISQRIIALHEEQKHLRDERDRLAKRLQELETLLHGATASETSVVQNAMEVLLKEKDSLLTERQRLQSELEALRSGSAAQAEDAGSLVNRMMEEKARLEDESQQLRERLNTIQAQIQALGIDDGVSGLSGLIARLYEEKALLKARLDAAQKERDVLLNERSRLADSIHTEKERDTFVQTLQTQIQNLAADREAALKQRDKLRTERDELHEKVNAVKEHRARLLAKASGLEMELGEAYEEQSKLRAHIQELADARSELLSIRDSLTAEVQRLQTVLNQMDARATGDPARLQRLSEDGVNTLKVMVDDLTAERNRLERELHQAKTLLSGVENQLSLSQRMAAVSPEGSSQTYQPQQPELLVGLVQELRTPMTSINGYVELLLGESAGILGEMQRKFLQRVAVNIARLSAMIDDLVHVTQLDTGQYRLEPGPVDVIALMEAAITAASMKFREKGLVVDLDLQDDLPLLPADQDALNQIIGQLLTNAYLVSPPDSEIVIQAQARSLALRPEAVPVPCVYIAVEDRGGGIAPEDLPRVFSRKYKAENPLIDGLGDTGVGMSIARALAEAHGGRLWVDIRPGRGSIFNVALPLNGRD